MMAEVLWQIKADEQDRVVELLVLEDLLILPSLVTLL